MGGGTYANIISRTNASVSFGCDVPSFLITAGSPGSLPILGESFSGLCCWFGVLGLGLETSALGPNCVWPYVFQRLEIDFDVD